MKVWPRSATNWRASGDRQGEPLERLGVLGDSGHLGLDRREVVLGEVAAGDDDVVIKAVGGGRAERQPDARKQPHDGAGHDVGGRVPQDVERLAVLGRQDLQLDGRFLSVLERAIEVDDSPLGRRRDRRVGQPLADPLGDLARADPVVIFLDRPIRQFDPNHRHRLPANFRTDRLIRPIAMIVTIGPGRSFAMTQEFATGHHTDDPEPGPSLAFRRRRARLLGAPAAAEAGPARRLACDRDPPPRGNGRKPPSQAISGKGIKIDLQELGLFRIFR